MGPTTSSDDLAGRRSERAPIHLPLVVSRAGESVECTAEELSCSGLLITEGSKFVVGQELDICFAIPDIIEAAVRGTIVRIDVFAEEADREVAAVEFSNEQPHFESTEFEKLGELLVHARELAKEIEKGGAIRGALAATPLTCVLHALARARCSGVLRLGENDDAGELVLDEGRLGAWRQAGRQATDELLQSLLSRREGSFCFEPEPASGARRGRAVDDVLRDFYASHPWR